MIDYRFEPDYTVSGRHYAHALISWPTVAAGAIAAIAIGFLLNVLGLAIGASAFNPFELDRQDQSISAGGGLYVIFAQFVAFQVGGYLASRAARYPDHFGGALNGFMVWALAVFAALVLAAHATTGAIGSDALGARIAENVGELSDAADGQSANAADLATAEDAAQALAGLAWWAAGALGLGLAGAIAGGWIGAHHPKWETRPRLDDRIAYQTSPEI
jgi:hypothetical protein